MKPEIKLTVFLLAAVLTWGTIFSLASCSRNPKRKAQAVAERALYATVDRPRSVKILAVSKPDSVFGREYITMDEQMNIAKAMMKINGEVMRATNGFDDINPADKTVSSLMERQMNAMSAMRSVVRMRVEEAGKKQPFTVWKVKIDYQAQSLERNLISAVRNVNSVYKTKDRDVLFNFIQEWNESKDGYTRGNKLDLSLTDDFKYFNDEGQDFIVLPGGQPITSYYASSDVQSVMPVDVMSDHFMGLVGKVVKYSREDLMNRLMEMLGTDSPDKIDANALSDESLASMREKMTYQSAQLFIEEPEQNLYPDAQRNLVLNLIRRLKKVQSIGSRRSSIVMTTHSPYVLSTLNTLVYDAFAMDKKPEDARLKEIVDGSTLLPLEAYSAYFIDKDGCFKDIMDKEIPMVSGVDLDGVSDWVDGHTYRINEILFGE